jgi:hypothetical protein
LIAILDLQVKNCQSKAQKDCSTKGHKKTRLMCHRTAQNVPQPGTKRLLGVTYVPREGTKCAVQHGTTRLLDLNDYRMNNAYNNNNNNNNNTKAIIRAGRAALTAKKL